MLCIHLTNFRTIKHSLCALYLILGLSSFVPRLSRVFL